MSPCFFCFKEIIESFPSALTGGLILAAACSFVGVFLVLKRGSFLGAALSQTAACGIASGLYFHFNPFLGAILFTFGAVTVLVFPSEERKIPRDAWTALLFTAASSLSILFVAKSATGLEEIKAFLYGDLLVMSFPDLKILSAIIGPAFLLLLIFLRPILYSFLDRDGARALQIRVRVWEFIFFYLSALIVSVASKFGGMLLVFSYLLIPAVTGLAAAKRLLPVLAISFLSAILSTLIGFSVSYTRDLPTNPVIIAISLGLLVGVLGLKAALFYCINYLKRA